MAKVANPSSAAVFPSAPEGRSPHMKAGVPGQVPSRPLGEVIRAPAFRPVRPSRADPLRQIVPPAAPGLPDLAAQLGQAGLELPAPLVQAHAQAMEALIAAHDGPVPEGRAAQASATLSAVHGAFLAHLPRGPAAAAPAFQAVASAVMAHALLINRVALAGEVPADIPAFLGSTQVLSPSRLR